MIYIDDHKAGYLLNETLLQFMNCRLLTASDAPEGEDIILYAHYLHNSTRSQLIAGGTDYAAISKNVNENNIEEPFASAGALRKIFDHPNGYLFLCNTWEYFPIFEKAFQNGMRNLMRYLGIPPQRVVASCCDALNPVGSRYLPIKAFGFDWAYLREKLNSGRLARIDADTQKQKHFIALNRRFTPDRFILFLFILAKKYQHQFHFSFLSRPLNAELPTIAHCIAQLPTMTPFIIDIQALIQQGLAQIPIELDANREDVEWSGTETITAYLSDACLFLLNETLPQANGFLFVSEKIYKPIRLGMPFIVYGGKGTLAHLRRLGFKSFHPFINERYDEEEDHLKRLDLILQEIDRLCRMDLDQIRQLHQQLLPVAEHNLNHLKHKAKVASLESVFRRCIAGAGPKRSSMEECNGPAFLY